MPYLIGSIGYIDNARITVLSKFLLVNLTFSVRYFFRVRGHSCSVLAKLRGVCPGFQYFFNVHEHSCSILAKLKQNASCIFRMPEIPFGNSLLFAKFRRTQARQEKVLAGTLPCLRVWPVLYLLCCADCTCPLFAILYLYPEIEGMAFQVLVGFLNLVLESFLVGDQFLAAGFRQFVLAGGQHLQG